MTSRNQNVSVSYPPQFLNEYNGDSLHVIAVLFIALATICVVLRFYARRVGYVPWGLDDSLIIPGTVFCLALCVCALGGYMHILFPDTVRNRAGADKHASGLI